MSVHRLKDRQIHRVEKVAVFRKLMKGKEVAFHRKCIFRETVCYADPAFSTAFGIDRIIKCFIQMTSLTLRFSFVLNYYLQFEDS